MSITEDNLVTPYFECIQCCSFAFFNRRLFGVERQRYWIFVFRWFCLLFQLLEKYCGMVLVHLGDRCSVLLFFIYFFAVRSQPICSDWQYSYQCTENNSQSVHIKSPFFRSITNAAWSLFPHMLHFLNLSIPCCATFAATGTSSSPSIAAVAELECVPFPSQLFDRLVSVCLRHL